MNSIKRHCNKARTCTISKLIPNSCLFNDVGHISISYSCTGNLVPLTLLKKYIIRTWIDWIRDIKYYLYYSPVLNLQKESTKMIQQVTSDLANFANNNEYHVVVSITLNMIFCSITTYLSPVWKKNQNVVQNFMFETK